MKLRIEQIAFGSTDPKALMMLLSGMLGLDEWHHDTVEAEGHVFGSAARNKAELHFNYQQGRELEVLRYLEGDNWHARHDLNNLTDAAGASKHFLSHIGMHVTQEEMDEAKIQMELAGVNIAQEVKTLSHTNPVIKDKRQYNYVIFDTRALLGFDVKLIVRHYINTDDIVATVVGSISKYKAIAASSIDLEDRLEEDLDMDWIDVIEMAMHLEGEINIEIPDDAMEGFNTVRDIVNYIASKR